MAGRRCGRTALRGALALTMLAATMLAAAPVAAGETASTERRYHLHAMDGSGTITLADLKGQWVVLHFLLKTVSPFCILHTSSYTLRPDVHPEARHIFIKPDEEAAIARWIEMLNAETGGASADFEAPVIYRDPHGAFARHLHITHGYTYNDEVMRFPAFVLFNPQGEEVFRHIGEHAGDRISVDQFATMMDAIQRPFRLEAMNLIENTRVAFGGYDPVVYFDEGEAQAGDPNRTYNHHGILIRFTSDDTRDRFAAEPERYLPAYGGWCAMGMAAGEMREVDPRNFIIDDGRLFLFARGVVTNARRVWEQDAAGNRAKADAQWEHIGGPVVRAP